VHTIQYRRWSPPQSPLGIEFPPEVLHEVRLEGARAAAAARLARTRSRDRAEDHSSGVLFGVRQKQEVRILAARSTPDFDDSRLAGLQPVGIFVCRARGEVFLTDSDLAMFETTEASVALVMAGGRAGFFVREGDGSIQAVQSHEEFSVANVAATPVEAAVPELPAPPPKRVLKRAMKGTGLLCVPVVVFAYLQPLLPQPPFDLAVREETGQLLVSWNVPLDTQPGRLEIVDGGERTLVHLSPAQTSLTFAHRTGDVEIRLDTGTREGSAHWKPPYYMARIPTTHTVDDSLLKLEREAKILRSSVESRKARADNLSRRINRLADQ